MSKFWQAATKWAWLLLLVFLPITSMPFVRDLISSDTTVATPSSLFLLLIVLFWLFPYLFKNGAVPSQVKPLTGFVIAALFATILAAYLPVPPFKDNSIFRNNLEGFITLGIACCFFLVAMLYPANQKILQVSLRWINWVGLIVLLWAFLQGSLWYFLQGYPMWARNFAGLYSVGPLYRQRASGFALEPSWFAHQLNMLYLPLWLAFTMRKQSVHRFRIIGLTLENILLVGGIIALGLTLSRIGFLAFILMCTYLLVRLVARFSRWLQDRIMDGKKIKGYLLKWRLSEKLVRILLAIILLVVYSGVLSGLAIGVSKVDPRMAKMFQIDFKRPDAFMYYANELTFASRIVYWQAGWNVFGEHPWLGVGLGNAGFFIPQQLSSYSWRLVEVRDLMYRSTSLLNIKAIWVRLLAETGIIGFSFFICWLFLLWKTARKIEKGSNPLGKVLGLFGQLVLLGFLIEGFSIDSFALPYAWFSFGLLMAASI